MAIVVTTPAAGTFGFFLNGVSADASACEELKAAPATGLSIYLDHLTVSSDSAITVTIGAGETGGAVTVALLGPIPFAINQQMQWTFLNGGLKLTAATSLTVDSSGAGNLNIFASGRVQ